MNRNVSIGGPIALMVIGAILYLALNVNQAGPANLPMIGLILGLAGLVWLIISLLQANRKRTAVTQERVVAQDAGRGVAGPRNGVADRETIVEDR